MRTGWLLNHGEVSSWGTNRVGLIGLAGLGRQIFLSFTRARAFPFGSGPENEKRKNDETMEFPWQSRTRVANASYICARPGGASDACIVGGVLRRDGI